ncbi:MAG TPA: STAS domain-containing protein [Rhodocyclaceae bacterium]|nr:STAS domain-containing protein [Rhodocyclaceae bacterium]
MAFSLFGKKQPPSPLGVKAPARPLQKPVAPAVQEELGSLDFTQPGELPSSSQARIEVQETAQQVPPVIEQAAMLYSIEQTQSACAALAAAVREQDLGSHAPRAWGMLFELYQLLGRQSDFEQLAVEYAGKFETSPPAWAAGEGTGPENAAPAGGKATVALSGVLNAKAQEALKQVFKVAEKSPAVKLELGKVTDVDEQGCALLNNVLWQMKRARKECVLGGADKIAALLARKIVPGRRENEQAWLLLLELYQQLSAQHDFEEAAVNYAVTFEVSPPSWEPVRSKSTVAAEVDTVPEIEEPPVCALEGCITAASDDAFATIRARAEATSDVEVDVSRLRRMDFVAAANLMNLVNALALAQKNVRLVRASHLLAALWEVIGLDRVAGIETRKA